MAAFGIPEAISAMNIVLDIAIKLKDESKELALVVKEIRKIKKDLNDIETRMKNPKSPLGQSDARIKARIEEDSKDIKEGCARVKKILGERARMYSFEFGSKIWFVTYRIPELKVIIAGFTATTTSIDKKINLLLADAAERAAVSQVKAQKKAEEQAAASLKAQKKAEAQAKKLDEKMDKIIKQQDKDKAAKEEQEKNIKKLIELLEKRDGEVVQDIASGKRDGKKTADGLVEELVSGGMKRKDAKAGVEATISAVRRESQSQKQTIKRAATAEAKKGAVTAKSGAAKAQNTAKPNQKPEVKKNNVWILCVDSANGPRSIMTQIYLEFVRSWTMNTQKRWIFERVHSLGVLISSSFTKSIIESEKLTANKANVSAGGPAIEAIAGDDSHFRTKDWPDEKGTILKRVRDHKSQGLAQTHFENYEHIICFEQSTFDLLEKLKKGLETGEKKVEVVSKIHLLQKCSWGANDNTDNKEDLLKMAGKLKVALKEFLKVQFKWERPAIGIASGEWRTLQLLVDEEVANKMKKDKGVLMNRILKKKGCTVHVAVDIRDKRLVSISGPKGKLAEAQELAVSS